VSTDKELIAACEEKIGGKAPKTILAWLVGADLSTFSKWGQGREIPRRARVLLEHIAASDQISISLEPARGNRIVFPLQHSVAESVKYEIREAVRDAFLDLKRAGRKNQRSG